MQDNKALLKSVSIFSIIGSSAYNFEAFVRGSVASFESACSFVIFVFIWIVILCIASKNKEAQLFVLRVWLFFTLSSAILLLTHLSFFSAEWLIPMFMIFNGALYGSNYLVGKDLASAAHLIISLTFTIICLIIYLKRRNFKKECG